MEQTWRICPSCTGGATVVEVKSGVFFCFAGCGLVEVSKHERTCAMPGSMSLADLERERDALHELFDRLGQPRESDSGEKLSTFSRMIELFKDRFLILRSLELIDEDSPVTAAIDQLAIWTDVWADGCRNSLVRARIAQAIEAFLVACENERDCIHE